MAQTANQKKMAALRAMRGKPKVGKKQAGGCPGKKGCMCGCGKKGQCGEGARLQAVAKAAKAAAAAAARGTKRAAEILRRNQEIIKKGLKLAGTAAGVAGSLTGNKALSTVGDIAGAFGEGKQRGGSVINSTTGELQAPSIYYPNSSALFTGKLVF